MTFGLMSGFVVLPLTQMLAAQHVPQARISAVTSAALSPGFWVFLLGPMLDVRLSRRAYATIFALLSGGALALGVLEASSLLLLEVLLLVGIAAATLSSNALGGWLTTITRQDEQARLSAWNQVGSFLGNGSIALLAGELLRMHTSTVVRAVALGSLVAAPAIIFLAMPAPGPDRRLARESFGQFFGEVWQLLRRTEVLLALLLFALPTGSFALTNQLGALGELYGAQEHFVSVMGGVGLVAVGSAACLALPLLLRWSPPLRAYLLVGAAGSAFTLLLPFAPHSPAWFAISFLGENAFQAASFTAAIAITFRTIGEDNPLAATQFSLMTAVTVLPIVYMGVLDGRVFSSAGLTPMLLVDGGVSAIACAGMALLLRRRA